jgi:tetratricopeptide (TPR) repeat protein
VQAGPPSAGYRLRKFVRRHRGPVLAAGLLFLVLLAGLSGTIWGLVRAEDSRAAEAKATQRETERAAGEARERERAEEERRAAEAVLQFLERGLLRQADPFAQADAARQAGGGFEAKENPSVRELLDRAAAELTAEKIESRFPGQPRVQIEVLLTVGRSYLGVGEYGKAIDHLERAVELMTRVLGPDDRRTLTTRGNLAVAFRRAGRTPEALARLEKLRDDMAATLGAQDSDTLTSMSQLAGVYQESGQIPRAIALFEAVRDLRAEKLGANHRHTLLSQDNLAGAYRLGRRPGDAVTLLESVRQATAAEFGPEHPTTLAMLDNLAGAYREVNRSKEAIELYESVLAACRLRLGPDHHQTLTTANNLAAAYWREKKFERSVPLFEEVLRSSQIRLGENHPDTLMAMANLGVNFADSGKRREGLALMEEVVARSTRGPGPFPAQLAWVPGMLASRYDRAAEYANSEKLYRWSMEEAVKRYGAVHRHVALQKNLLGLNLMRQKKFTEAEAVLRESLEAYEKTAAGDWKTFETRALLGGALLEQSKAAEAGPHLEAGYRGMKARSIRATPANRARLREALDWLVREADARGDSAAMEKWQKERGSIGS